VRGPARRALLDLARTCPPDAILAHYGHAGLRMRPVAQALGVPLVVHFHGGDISSSLRNRWYRWSLLHELPHFDAMVVVGSHQRDWLLAQGAAPERVHLIPCGVPVDEFQSAGQRQPGPARFLTVSRLVPQKGLDICLQALARIAPECPGATLTIVGDGPERERLDRMAVDLGLQDRVRFTGALRSAEVRQEMQAATVFLQHSLDWNGQIEGFGVSVTEAAAMELPVIVSRSGGLVDQVVDSTTGFIVDQRDVAALAEAMRTFARDPDRAHSMGQAGRRHVGKNFDTLGQVAKLETVLCGLLPKSRGRPL
jgi:glycosyltransferase involved in cell wall biosynthesis